MKPDKPADEDHGAAAPPTACSARKIATWLLDAFERRWPEERTRSALMSEFDLSEVDATEALEQARDGVIRAIGGKQSNRPDPHTAPVALESYDLLWSSFNTNEFFARSRAPTRKWLDWYRDFRLQQEVDARHR